MSEKINLGVVGKLFGDGSLTVKKDSIKFYVGANFAWGEDTDIYLCADDFDEIANDAKRIAKELRDLQKGGQDEI